MLEGCWGPAPDLSWGQWSGMARGGSGSRLGAWHMHGESWPALQMPGRRGGGLCVLDVLRHLQLLLHSKGALVMEA